MRRRAGFTLIEMLVAIALTIFVMVILSQAFVAGLETFRQLRGIGDMQQSLRTAALRIQNDLRADHFEAGRRLSDVNFWGDGQPQMGFFKIIWPGNSTTSEGVDLDNIPSNRAAGHVLHFSVRLRGNHREGFLSAAVPAGSPLFSQSTTLGNQPADARYQDQSNTYTSAWGEVAYFLVRQGSTGEPNNPGSTLGTPLFVLYRIQKAVVADSSAVNGQNIPSSQASSYAEMSCQPGGNNNSQLIFNSPADLAGGQRSITNFAPGPGASPLLGNVVSFEVQWMLLNQPSFSDPGTGNNGFTFDTATPANNNAQTVVALQITLRVWDAATQQARQVTFIQDM